jgi:hypothetical protein
MQNWFANQHLALCSLRPFVVKSPNLSALALRSFQPLEFRVFRVFRG